MVPISTLVTLKKVFGPQGISRYNLYNSISVNVNAGNGASTGKVMNVIDEVLQKELPKGYSYEYNGLSLQERKSSSQMIFIFGLSILFVYFLLAAQYESYLLPLAVMLSLLTIFEAGIAGARMRLRPILMTSFAFVAGLIPLMFAKGGTAIGNKSISISAAGGMLSGVLLGLLIIPVLYMIFQRLQEKVSGSKNL